MFNMIRVIDGYNDSTLQIILNIYKTEKIWYTLLSF